MTIKLSPTLFLIFVSFPAYLARIETTKATYKPSLEESGLLSKDTRGTALEEGFHAFLVLFFKEDKRQSNPSEFDLKSLICSGTLMNRRWILTTSVPIGQEEPENIVAIIKKEIEIPIVKEEIKDDVFEIQNIELSPDFDKPDVVTLALVKIKRPVTFNRDLLTPELVKLDHPKYMNCKLITWSLNETTVNAEKNTYKFYRSSVNFAVDNNGSCGERYCTLSHSGNSSNARICGLNKGAPLVCDVTLWAVVTETGSGEQLDCVKTSETFRALNIHNVNDSSATVPFDKWMSETISATPDDEFESGTYKEGEGDCDELGRDPLYMKCGQDGVVQCFDFHINFLVIIAAILFNFIVTYLIG